MLSIARSSFTLPSQLAFLTVNAFALIIGVVYNHQTPELYAGNSHSKTGWAITWIASAWVFMWVVQMYTTAQGHQDQATQPMTTANIARYQRVHQDSPYISRWSNDSGQGTERDSTSLFGHSRSPSVQSENQQLTSSVPPNAPEDEDYLDETTEKRSFLRNTTVDRFFSRNVARFAVGRTLKAIRFFYILFERTLLVQGLVAICTGTVVYGGIGVSCATMFHAVACH